MGDTPERISGYQRLYIFTKNWVSERGEYGRES
jgi:hypothetical protein